MTGPSAPRNVDTPRPVRQRLPQAHPPETQPFPALITGDQPGDSAFNATPFERDGVLGRPVFTPPADAPPVQRAAVVTSDAPPSLHQARRLEGPEAALATGMRREAAMQSQQPNSSDPTPVAISAVIRTSEDIASYAPQSNISTPRGSATDSERAGQARPASRSAANKANVNPIFVAIRALEQGCVVYARAGRMSATERQNLRHSVRALLAEHGLSSEGIWIDGADAITDSGEE